MSRLPGAAPQAVPRREFLARILKVTGAGAALSALTWAFHDRPPRSRKLRRGIRDFRTAAPGPALAVARGPSPAANARALLAALGGMERFVGPGERVLLKPNVGWDRIPEQAANTNPELVGELARLCREAGAGEVLVADIPCNDARRSFERSGIREAAERAGARVVHPPLEHVEVDLGGLVLGTFEVMAPLLAADRVINIPVVKHHAHARATLGLKNWYGVLGRRRFLLHQDIHRSIVELGQAVRPTLTVVDATRVLLRNGPQGGSLADVREEHAMAAGTDPVALDAWGAEVLGIQARDLEHLVLGSDRGLGRLDWRSLAPREVQLG